MRHTLFRMDDPDVGAHPHCPNDDVVMRDVPGGWECPKCGFVEQTQDLKPLSPSDGPDLYDR